MHKNLDEIDDIAGTVEIDGVAHNVLSMDGDGFRLMKKLNAGEIKDDSDALWELGARLCPTADVWKLSGKKLGYLLGIAQLPAAEVEKQFPNADGPGETSPPAQG